MAAAFLVVALLTVVAIDVFDAFGVRERLFVRRDSEYPWVFHHLFSDGHPVEWLQWLLLVVATTAVMFSAGRLHASGDARRTWGVALLGFTFGLLVVHDAGDPRHVANWMAEGVMGSTVGEVVELVFFVTFGLLAAAGLLTAWSELRQRRAPRRLILAAYGVYGVAALFSATSDLWYERAGAWVVDALLGGRLLPAPAGWRPGLRSWLFMDSLLEESVELVAAGLLATGALLLLRDVLSPGPVQHAPPHERAVVGQRRR